MLVMSSESLVMCFPVYQVEHVAGTPLVMSLDVVNVCWQVSGFSAFMLSVSCKCAFVGLQDAFSGRKLMDYFVVALRVFPQKSSGMGVRVAIKLCQQG